MRCSECRTTFRLTLDAAGQVVIHEAGETSPRRVPPSGKARPPSDRRRRGHRRRILPTTPRAGAADGPSAAPAEEDIDFESGFGERIGRYEVEALLGRGGMAAVYRAFDPAANRHVALKVLSADAPPDDQARFQREVQVQGNIHHPHIMHIYDSGSMGRSRHFAMELLRDPISLTTLGTMALEGRAGRDPHLRPASTIEGIIRQIILPVCEAIHHANVREGVIHRDLKPDNVLIDRNGLRPFVSDFGICSVIDRKNQRLAHLPKETPGRLAGGGVRVTGTLVYMPPEQARGAVDRRGDVWATGALLHFLLTGAAPLAPASQANVSAEQRIEGLRLLIEQAGRAGKAREEVEYRRKLRDVESGRERTLEDLQRDVLAGNYLPLPARAPRGLVAIVHKAMAREPEDRYRHALDLHRDLEAWLDGDTVRAQVERTNPLLRPVYRAGVLLRRHGWALLLLLLAGLGGAWAAFGRGAEDTAVVDATNWLAEAEEALADGRSRDARAALVQAIGDDPATRSARALLATLDREATLTEAIERGEQLTREMRAAFDEGRGADGLAALAALREALATRVLPCVEDGTPSALCVSVAHLQTFARGDRPLALSRPVDTVEAIPIDARTGAARFADVRSLDGDAARLGYGTWLLRTVRDGGELMLPLQVPPGTEPVEVELPVDPARIPTGLVYVPAGPARGPGGEGHVAALLWDATEVSGARYARFLASLDPRERHRRIPREAGPLGAPGRPLWDTSGDDVVLPPDAARRPVEGVSYQDARAFATFEGARLPTAMEWARAAGGGDGRSTPVGSVEAALGSGANLGGRHATTFELGGAANDRSPYGLFDMTGNVAELTATLGTLRGENGWLVMGGSYLSSPAGALITEAVPVAGWEPRLGVGFRLVRGVERLTPATAGAEEE